MTTYRRTELARLRRDLGFTQERLAEHLGVSRNTVTRWERGEGGFPHPASAVRLATALEVSMQRLRQLFGPGDSQTEPGPAPVWPVQFEGEVHLSGSGRSSYVDRLDLPALRQEVDRLDALYDSLPSTSLLPAAGRCLSELVRLREVVSGDAPRSLLALEADAATLMGMLAWDASQRRQLDVARSYFEQAAAAAREIGYRVAESYAILRISYLALYGEDNPVNGLAAAEHARERAPQESAVLCGLTTLHVAEGLAMLGRRSECEQALRTAETSFDAVHGGDPAIRFFSASQLKRMAGSCYLSLGLPRRAVATLDASAGSSPTGSKSKALVLGNLGLAHGRLGEIDRAAGALHAGIDLLEQNRGGGGMNVVTKAALELRPWRSEPVVADVHDRLLALGGS